jgi:hypothetical protein
MTLATRSLLLAGVALLAACAGGRRAAPTREPTYLMVDNRGYADMRIYVFVGSSRRSMGVAGGLKISQLTIPAHVVGTAAHLRFQADPIGSSRQAFSQELYVREGDRLTLTIPP